APPLESDGSARTSTPPSPPPSTARWCQSWCSDTVRRSTLAERACRLRVAARVRSLGGHVPPRRLDRAAGTVPVVVAHPVAQVVARTRLVAALRRHVEIPIDAEKFLAAPTVGRIRVEDVARGVLVE